MQKELEISRLCFYKQRKRRKVQVNQLFASLLIFDFFLIKLIQILAAVKINDDNDLNDIFNEIDDDSFNLTATLKATPKSAKKKKKMKLSAVSSLTVSRAELDTSSKFDSTKKRVLTERVTQPSKKAKLELDVKYESVKKRIESKGFFFKIYSQVISL